MRLLNYNKRKCNFQRSLRKIRTGKAKEKDEGRGGVTSNRVTPPPLIRAI